MQQGPAGLTPNASPLKPTFPKTPSIPALFNNAPNPFSATIPVQTAILPVIAASPNAKTPLKPVGTPISIPSSTPKISPLTTPTILKPAPVNGFKSQTPPTHTYTPPPVQQAVPKTQPPPQRPTYPTPFTTPVKVPTNLVKLPPNQTPVISTPTTTTITTTTTTTITTTVPTTTTTTPTATTLQQLPNTHTTAAYTTNASIPVASSKPAPTLPPTTTPQQLARTALTLSSTFSPNQTFPKPLTPATVPKTTATTLVSTHPAYSTQGTPTQPVPLVTAPYPTVVHPPTITSSPLRTSYTTAYPASPAYTSSPLAKSVPPLSAQESPKKPSTHIVSGLVSDLRKQTKNNKRKADDVNSTAKPASRPPRKKIAKATITPLSTLEEQQLLARLQLLGSETSPAVNRFKRKLALREVARRRGQEPFDLDTRVTKMLETSTKPQQRFSQLLSKDEMSKFVSQLKRPPTSTTSSSSSSSASPITSSTTTITGIPTLPAAVSPTLPIQTTTLPTIQPPVQSTQPMLHIHPIQPPPQVPATFPTQLPTQSTPFQPTTQLIQVSQIPTTPQIQAATTQPTQLNQSSSQITTPVKLTQLPKEQPATHTLQQSTEHPNVPITASQSNSEKPHLPQQTILEPNLQKHVQAPLAIETFTSKSVPPNSTIHPSPSTASISTSTSTFPSTSASTFPASSASTSSTSNTTISAPTSSTPVISNTPSSSSTSISSPPIATPSVATSNSNSNPIIIEDDKINDNTVYTSSSINTVNTPSTSNYSSSTSTSTSSSFKNSKQQQKWQLAAAAPLQAAKEAPRTVKEAPRTFRSLLEGEDLSNGFGQPLVSPYTLRTLKPYIWRDYKSRPQHLRFLEELAKHPRVLRARRENGFPESETEEFSKYPIDYVYFRPWLLPQVNAFLCSYFWPGIDVRDCLEYPDYTVCALYRNMLVGCGFMTPDAYVIYIAVRHGWRDAGIATFMLYHLSQTIQGKDITLHVSATNPAMLLYQKFGFKPEEYIVNFYNQYYPDDSLECKHAYMLRLRR